MTACHPFRRGCMTGQDSQNEQRVEFMKGISNTQTSRTYVEREEHDRISAHLDRALELTFPCSDPVAITINGIYDVVRRKAATDESLSPKSVSKD
jgi:hypothetical protein